MRVEHFKSRPKSSSTISRTVIAVLTETFKDKLNLDPTSGNSGLFKNDVWRHVKVVRCPTISTMLTKATKIRRFGPTQLDQIRNRLQKVSQELERFNETSTIGVQEDRSPWSFSQPIPTIERRLRSEDSDPTFKKEEIYPTFGLMVSHRCSLSQSRKRKFSSPKMERCDWCMHRWPTSQIDFRHKPGLKKIKKCQLSLGHQRLGKSFSPLDGSIRPLESDESFRPLQLGNEDRPLNVLAAKWSRKLTLNDKREKDANNNQLKKSLAEVKKQLDALPQPSTSNLVVGQILREIVDRAFFKSLVRRKNAEKIASGNQIQVVVEIDPSSPSTEIIYASETSEDDENFGHNSSMMSHDVDMMIPTVYDKIFDFFGRMKGVINIPETDDEEEYTVENPVIPQDAFLIKNPSSKVKSKKNLFEAEIPFQTENGFQDIVNENPVSILIPGIIEDLIKTVTENQNLEQNELSVGSAFPVEKVGDTCLKISKMVNIPIQTLSEAEATHLTKNNQTMLDPNSQMSRGVSTSQIGLTFNHEINFTTNETQPDSALETEVALFPLTLQMDPMTTAYDSLASQSSQIEFTFTSETEAQTEDNTTETEDNATQTEDYTNLTAFQTEVVAFQVFSQTEAHSNTMASQTEVTSAQAASQTEVTSAQAASQTEVTKIVQTASQTDVASSQMASQTEIFLAETASQAEIITADCEVQTESEVADKNRRVSVANESNSADSISIENLSDSSVQPLVSFVRQVVEPEIEGLVVENIPKQVCQISQIATILEKFGSVQSISIFFSEDVGRVFAKFLNEAEGREALLSLSKSPFGKKWLSKTIKTSWGTLSSVASAICTKNPSPLFSLIGSVLKYDLEKDKMAENEPILIQEFRSALLNLTTINPARSVRHLKSMYNIIYHGWSKSLSDQVVTKLESLLYKATSHCDCDQVSEDSATLRKSILKTLKDRLIERFKNSQVNVLDQLLEVADASLVRKMTSVLAENLRFSLRPPPELALMLEKIVELVKSKFAGQAFHSLAQTVMKVFRSDPASNVQLITKYGSEQDVANACIILSDRLKGLEPKQVSQLLTSVVGLCNYSKVSEVDTISQLLLDFLNVASLSAEQLGLVFMSNLVQSNQNLFDACLASTTAKLRSDPNELNIWIIFCRKMPQWVGNGEFAQSRQKKLCESLLEFAENLKRISSQMPRPAFVENWVRDVSLIKPCSSGTSRCPGCQQLIDFLEHPGKMSQNITVNEKGRSCIKKLLKNPCGGFGSEKVSDKLRLVVEELDYRQNQKLYHSGRCGAIDVRKCPLNSDQSPFAIGWFPEAMQELAMIQKQISSLKVFSSNRKRVHELDESSDEISGRDENPSSSGQASSSRPSTSSGSGPTTPKLPRIVESDTLTDDSD